MIGIERGRFDYPTLKARALSLAKYYRLNKVLIEDAGAGTALIQELHSAGESAVAVLPVQNKIVRMSIQSAKIESGHLYLPTAMQGLEEFEAELFSFPNGKHDDQVDTVSQCLANATLGYTLDNSLG